MQPSGRPPPHSLSRSLLPDESTCPPGPALTPGPTASESDDAEVAPTCECCDDRELVLGRNEDIVLWHQAQTSHPTVDRLALMHGSASASTPRLSLTVSGALDV